MSGIPMIDELVNEIRRWGLTEKVVGMLLLSAGGLAVAAFLGANFG
ncbi:MAG TPA: hypothetical protein VF796_25895 [Humisphaera sp.]